MSQSAGDEERRAQRRAQEMSRGEPYEKRRAREAHELAKDQDKLVAFRRSLPSRKTSELFGLLFHADSLCTAIDSGYEIVSRRAAQDIYAEIDQRLPPREPPVEEATPKEGA